MGVQVDLTDIKSGQLSPSVHSSNNTKIEQSLDEALSRSNNVNNNMEQDFDMGSYKIFNMGVAIDPHNAVPLHQVAALISDLEAPLYTQIENQFSTLDQTTFLLDFITYTPTTNNLTVFQNGERLVLGIDYSEEPAFEGETTSATVHIIRTPTGVNDGDTFSFVRNYTQTTAEKLVYPQTAYMDTSPPDPYLVGVGTSYYDMNDGREYINVDDGDSRQWVEASPAQARSAVIGIAANVSYDTSDGTLSPTSDTVKLALDELSLRSTAAADVSYDSSGNSLSSTNVQDALTEIHNNTLNPSLVNALYPVGSLYFNANVATNPATLLGHGTWSLYAQGRAVIGVGTYDDGTSTETIALGENIGKYKHKLTINEMPAHSHSTSGGGVPASTGASGDNKNVRDQAGPTGTTGGNAFHNNIQPSIGVYIWRRTA